METYPKLFASHYFDIFLKIAKYPRKTFSGLYHDGHTPPTIQKAIKYFLEMKLIEKQRQGREVYVSYTLKGALILRHMHDTIAALNDVIELPNPYKKVQNAKDKKK